VANFFSIVAVLLVLYGLALAWLAVGVRVDPGTASQFQLDVVYEVMRWIAAAAMVFTSVYLCWSGFTERLLDAPLRVWRPSGVADIRHGMGHAAACGRRAVCRNSNDGRLLDAFSGAAAADGQRRGALGAQPRSPYMRRSRRGRVRCNVFVANFLYSRIDVGRNA
jgi:hypothetical protein